MDAVWVRKGAEQVFAQVDSGAVPVGKRERPKRDPADKTQAPTPVRRLFAGCQRVIVPRPREVRVAAAWQPGQVDGEVANLYIAPHERP